MIGWVVIVVSILVVLAAFPLGLLVCLILEAIEEVRETSTVKNE